MKAGPSIDFIQLKFSQMINAIIPEISFYSIGHSYEIWRKYKLEYIAFTSAYIACSR